MYWPWTPDPLGVPGFPVPVLDGKGSFLFPRSLFKAVFGPSWGLCAGVMNSHAQDQRPLASPGVPSARVLAAWQGEGLQNLSSPLAWWVFPNRQADLAKRASTFYFRLSLRSHSFPFRMIRLSSSSW